MLSLRIIGLTHEFEDREVLRGIDFRYDGRCLVVCGRNGSGKSTLLRILAGLLTPTAGDAHVCVDGEPVQRHALMNMIGLAAPDVRLYADLTARENLRFLMSARNACGDERIQQALGEVGLTDRADDPIGELSSGLRQRACLAAAIVHGPKVLMLDEPSSNLDEEGVRMVRSLIDRYGERGMVVLASNDPSEVELGDTRLELGAVI